MGEIERYLIAGDYAKIEGGHFVTYSDHLAVVAEKDEIIKKLAERVVKFCGCDRCCGYPDAESCDPIDFLRSLGIEVRDE